jgi:hypothetical protein
MLKAIIPIVEPHSLRWTDVEERRMNPFHHVGAGGTVAEVSRVKAERCYCFAPRLLRTPPMVTRGAEEHDDLRSRFSMTPTGSRH